MTELVKQVAEQWEGHGILALLTTIVAVVVSTVISRYLDHWWRHGFEEKIEEFKQRHEQDRLAINAALSSLNTATASSHPAILEAVKTLWDAILKLNDAFAGPRLYADILTKEEWCKIPSSPRRRHELGDISDGALMRFMSVDLAAAEHTRPFVGESIWSMYWIYRAFVLRIVTIVQMNIDKGRLPYWYDDQVIQGHVRLLLTEEEIRAIERYPGARFGQIRQLAEGKIIAEMNRIIAGHKSADSGLEQARRVLRAAAEIETAAKSSTSA